MQLKDAVHRIPTLAMDAICVVHRASLDAEPEIKWVNDAFLEMFATSREQILGTPPRNLVHDDHVDNLRAAVRGAISGGKTKLAYDAMFVRLDGSAFWGSIRFTFVVSDEAGVHEIFIVRDIDVLINREQSAELALIENEALLAEVEATRTRLVNALNSNPDPFAIFDAKGRLVVWNPAYAKYVSDDPEDLKRGMRIGEILDAGLRSGYISEAIGQEEEFKAEFMANWNAGDTVNGLIRVRGRDYKVINSTSENGERVVLRSDITDHIRQQKELELYAQKLSRANQEISHQALHDELTGLGNRRFLQNRLNALINVREKTGMELAALHIDLDRFKQINDTMGHAAGDHVLRSVADILRISTRKRDVVARIGGDEFIVLMICDSSSDEPEFLADRLVAEISKPIMFEERPCRLGASVGIARTPVIGADELLTCSDIALYKAKSGGRSMKAVFDKADLDNMRAVKRLGDDILRGLEAEEFVPVFQPQIDMRTGRVVAVEALARWQHPELGLLPPAEFLEVATDIQVDKAIDRLIFRAAIQECKTQFTDAAEKPTLSFNVSLARLMEPGLISEIEAMDYAGQIGFELIETTFFDNEPEEFFARIDALRSLGIEFEVDDFGSGHASIVGLRRIAPERLKIDKRLILPVDQSDSARKLVRSIIEIGRALDIGVTAEGVERAEHVRVLTELGCDRLQGFYYAKPCPLAEAMACAEASTPQSECIG
ncbi:MAG: EAL domain-containing protein [Paracoccaceae bacterium]|nr:EAL domain-containing protein [Paracoccaceae bacterium]